MNTLFISTYNDLVTIGLLKDGKEIEKKEKVSNRSHSIILVPTIEEILNDNNLEVNDLSEIIVVNGPGSFTGIRLGITVAKTLAYTLNIPIKTITSLEAIGISIDNENKIVLISDNKGKFIGKFTNNKLEEMLYINNSNIKDYFDNNSDYQLYEDVKELKLETIYEYCKTKTDVPAHGVKAVYIKEIEALNGK